MHIKSLTALPADICHYRPWLIIESNTAKELEVLACRAHGKGFIAQIKAVTDRDHAAALSGQTIHLPTDELPKLPEGEYYLRDLIGATVITAGGASLGTIRGIIETGGAHDVLQVKDAAGTENLIPWLVAEGVILDVNLNERRVTVDWESDE